MIARGYFILTILVNRVLSLPVTPTYLEKEDVEVMKCIVEVLADVLSKPHRLAVSQECLNILRTDERLVSILRHRNFLKELQDIAVEGANERAQQHVDITADHVTKKPQGPQGIDEAADRSMLAALGGPGERSILSQKRGTGGEGEGEGEGEAENSAERDGESSRERNEIIRKGEEKKREKDETPDNRISDAMNKEGKEEEEDVDVIEKKEEEEGDEKEKEEDEEKRTSSREDGEEAKTEGGNVTLDKKVAESGEVTDAPEDKSEERKSAEENEEELEEKRSALPLQDSAEAKKEWEEEEEEDEGEVKRKVAGVNHWSRMSELARSLQTKKRAGEEEKLQEVKSLKVGGQHEVPHHSKEVVEEEVEEKRKVGEARKSPEVKELQMMARREPQERREGEEEEGSTSRKTEDPEIESLAAIESELESVAQKLHELRRG
ncbi:chromogranin-A isoform X1 [Salvelinus fontinalis]|uniref:chromogranin-A isoform X1 n=1 Tax=Salvelinus fontinalis TaxID=8038 RepID=UPI002486894A|nr:chromogranin-A isoform X1 [Salvelinus fontinalis]